MKIAEQNLIVYKKLRDNQVAELLIPQATKYELSFNSEYNYWWGNARKAKVIDGNGQSLADPSFKYVKGEYVYPRRKYYKSINRKGGGIFFFMERKYAEAYPALPKAI